MRKPRIMYNALFGTWDVFLPKAVAGMTMWSAVSFVEALGDLARLYETHGDIRV